VQAVCDSFPALHTCPERHSLIISGCLSLTSVHCACALHPHRAGRALMPNHAYWSCCMVPVNNRRLPGCGSVLPA
jgi:F-box and leucine-rich repeat protein 1 (S-phase kinase-associated protein 2)